MLKSTPSIARDLHFIDKLNEFSTEPNSLSLRIRVSDNDFMDRTYAFVPKSEYDELAKHIPGLEELQRETANLSATTDRTKIPAICESYDEVLSVTQIVAMGRD